MVSLHVAFTASNVMNNKMISIFRYHLHPCTGIEQFFAVMFVRLVITKVRKLFGMYTARLFFFSTRLFFPCIYLIIGGTCQSPSWSLRVRAITSSLQLIACLIPDVVICSKQRSHKVIAARHVQGFVSASRQWICHAGEAKKGQR